LLTYTLAYQFILLSVISAKGEVILVVNDPYSYKGLA